MPLPTRIGRYAVRRRIGSGGFATVWLGYDESLDSPVAIKVLADNWSRNADVRRRFIDEAIEKVRHILDLRRASLEALTKRLIDVESIDADELKRIIDENSPTPLVVPGTETPFRLAPPEAVVIETATGMEKSG